MCWSIEYRPDELRTNAISQLESENMGALEEIEQRSKEYYPDDDRVNHPVYYNTNCPIIRVKCKCGEVLESSIECIDVIRDMPTWKGSAIKYLWRVGLKEEKGMTDKEKAIEDLRKAIFYIKDKIKMLENE